MIRRDRLVSYTVSGSPASRVEPLTLDMAKKAIRFTSDAEDGLLLGWIAAARAYFEETAGRQTIEAIYDYTCAPGLQTTIEIPRPPLVAVQSVTVRDRFGAEQLLDPSEYRVVPSGVPLGSPASMVYDAYCPPGVVTLLNGPRNGQEITIRRTCGYGTTPEQMPDLIRAALQLLVGHFHKFRAEVVEVQPGTTIMQLPIGAESLICGFKWSALVTP